MVYARITEATSRTGNWALWSLVVFLLLVYIGNVFGPVPEDTGSIGYVGLSQWLLVAWGYWVDGKRRMKLPV